MDNAVTFEKKAMGSSSKVNINIGMQLNSADEFKIRRS